jgi:serine/threonine-protein kinase RsbW
MPERLIQRLCGIEKFTKIIIQGNNSMSPELAGESASRPVIAARSQGPHLVGERPDRLEAIDWHTRTLHSRADIVPAIEEALLTLESAGYSSKEQFAVRLSLEEALINAIKHGHQDDPSKQARLRYRLTPDSFLAEIEDQGPGFRPDAVPDPSAPENRDQPCGRGLLLMRHYMTSVRFNAVGNRVTLFRCRISA